MRQTLVTLSLLFIISVALSPMAAVFWSTRFASRHGCSVNEGFAQTCIVDGKDWGPTLTNAFAAGWLMLIGLPIAILALLYLLIRTVRAIRARRA